MVEVADDDWQKLYETWLKDLIDTAVSTNSALMYTRAYRSLRESTKNYINPQDLKELKFIGQKICDILERKTIEYCRKNDIELPPGVIAEKGDQPSKARRAQQFVQFISPEGTKTGQTADGINASPKKKKPRSKGRTYIPRFRSGGYALLIALRKYSRQDGQGLGRTDLSRLARPYCDKPFESNSSASGFYTAWNGMSTLLKNDLVYQTSTRSPHYLITETGIRVADKLIELHEENSKGIVIGNSESAGIEGVPFENDIIVTDSDEVAEFDESPTRENLPSSKVTSRDTPKTNVWSPGSFRVILLLDNREVLSRDSRNYFEAELLARGVEVETCALSVGDCQWIAEHCETKHRVVLDYILERKRLDDLLSSIKDGRLHEQKQRLHRSSLRNVIYLIEEPSGLTMLRDNKAVVTVLSQTSAVDQFHLVRTTSADDTVRYLHEATKSIKEQMMGKSLNIIWPDVTDFTREISTARVEITDGHELGIDIDSFATALNKSKLLTVKEIFIRMLMTTRGVTYDRALIVQSLFKTPALLVEAFDDCVSEAEKKDMLFNATQNHVPLKRISKKLSESLFLVWGDDTVDYP